MKKILWAFLLWALILPSWVHASTPKSINISDSFIFFAEQYKAKTPDSFQYIDLKYTGVPQGSKLEDALQILVYQDLIKNTNTRIRGNKKASLAIFEAMSQNILWVKVSDESSGINKKLTYATYDDLKNIQNILNKRNNKKTISIISWNSQSALWKKWEILEDVYKTLRLQHYDKKDIKADKLVQGAIKWLAEGVGDKYTSYFPPVESKNFFTSLDGEFEWIWAYVDMTSPWELIIVSPIVWSPAEKAGLKWWDRITHVDRKEITQENSISEAISWIKWPKGSKVELTISREWEKDALIIVVTRDKINIKDVEFEKLDNRTAYIQIKNFGETVDSEFNKFIDELKEDTRVRKIIFDVRNNPGGYLDKVSKMLWNFVPKDENTAIVNQGWKDLYYKSIGRDSIDLNKYEVIILQNGGSASASEIFTGTLKDYFPKLTIIGGQSFGKWSVQSLKKYYDGSTLKFTTARWYTWKNRNGIDWVWISPDIKLEFDDERWKKFKKDNQLERAQKH